MCRPTAYRRGWSFPQTCPKAVIESLDELAGIHPAFAKVSLDNILEGFGSPLHPGALRYYREVGVPGIEDFVARTTR